MFFYYAHQINVLRIMGLPENSSFSMAWLTIARANVCASLALQLKLTVSHKLGMWNDPDPVLI